MEEWQKEITYHKPFYFKARLTAKYRGELNNYLTEKDTQHREHFKLSYFYDIQLDELIEISDIEYELIEKSFDIVNHDTIVGEYKGEQFALKPLELFVLKGVKPDHIQHEDDGIHGHFVNVPIVFKVLKPKKKLVCIEGAITKRETLEDGSIQITQIIDSETCETKTLIIAKPSPGKKPECIEGAGTGNERIKNGWLEYEYTRSDCTRYWKQIEIKCKPGYTGKTREYQGVLQREYINGDCSIGWDNDNEPNGCVSTPSGCWEIMSYIILAALILLVLGILIYHGLFKILGFIILIGAVLIGMTFLIQLLSRFSTFFINLFRVLLNIAMASAIILLLYGLIQFFQTDHSRVKRKSVIENRSEDKKQISRPKPVPVPKPTPKTDSTRIEKDPVDTIQQIEINVRWRALDGELYQGSYKLDVPDIRSSYNYIRSFTPYNTSSFGSLYGNLSIYDDPKMQSLYEMLDSIKTENKLSDRRFLDVIVSMVQSQEYVLVLDKSCNDPQVLSDRTLRNLINSGVSCEAFHPFGLKSPIEFLTDLTGDCDTRTVVLYTILKHYDYDVSIINSDHYAHSMLGVDIEGANGSKKVFGRNNYYFWETTSKGFELGFLPHEVNRIVFWDIVLN